MSGLIKTINAEIGTEEVNAVNARELWGFLESGTQFNHWINRRIKEYGFVKDIDFTVVKKDQGKNGRFTGTEFIITLDMAKELSMVENNDKGREARRYFIEVEKRARNFCKNLPSSDVLMATLYSEMERRITAETERDNYKKQLQRIVIASKLNFGEISSITGLPKDIVIGSHCKSSKKPHQPQYPQYIQLVLPLREIVDEIQKQIAGGIQ